MLFRSEDPKEYEAMKTRIGEELKRVFRPEFINRIDESIVFHALTAANIRQIVNLMLGSVRKQVVGRGMTLTVTDAVLDKLAVEGFDPQYGARPLRRAVQRLIEDPLAEEVLLGRFETGDTIQADVEPEPGAPIVEGEEPKTVIIFRKSETDADGETGLGGNDREPALLTAGFPPRGFPELPPPGLKIGRAHV